MITLRPAFERGHVDHGWLEAFHSFSFASYRDPLWDRFGALRVLNQDRVLPGQGFRTHGHADMEIVTWVLDGVLEHRDSMGHTSLIRPGDAQFMSAGSGVTHSEHNGSGENPLHLLQMWVEPREAGTPPRYAERSFDEAGRRGRLQLILAPDGEAGSLTIGQDARLSVVLLDGDEQVSLDLPAERAAWVQVARGQVRLNGATLGPGDGAGLVDEARVRLDAGRDAEVLVWELPRP